ncbi:MAG TPA: ABC transporter permease [Syntrophorhabdaceae bacterium]|nr:ABC transporter permease [Syntrophorhabdaceae bacterium]
MISIPWTCQLALRALRINKMRSALTMLGIIIGVGAVVTMVAVGAGATRKLEDQIAMMGSNLLIVAPGSQTSGGVRMGFGTQQTLTLEDAYAIERECSAVQDIGPTLEGGVQIVAGNLNWATRATGTTPGMLNVRDWPLSSGRPMNDEDIKSSAKVVILGQTIVDNLFGGIDPIDQIVRIKKLPFKVIGVLASKGQSMVGQDQDDIAYVPVTTAQKKLFRVTFPDQVRMIMIKARSLEAMPQAETQITDLLRQRHRIGEKKDDDFSIRNLTQFMETAQEQTRIMTLLLGAIASISLLVGGIGIMNIMLVSVTERTREIGIRMAIGAKTWDIRLQFIMEAVILSLMGGLVGLSIGFAGSKVVSAMSGWPTEVSALSAILAFAFSGVVGIFFGFYPAYKASLLNPIDALRYE